MPTSSNQCQNRMPKIVECCDILVAILCGSIIILTASLMANSGFEIIDQMIAVDTSFETGEEGALSPGRFLPWLIVCALAGIVAAIFGCGGVAPRDNPGCLSTHLLMMLILGVVFLVISMSCSQFEDTMEPVIVRQVSEFCGPATYPTYADSFNCSTQPLNVVSPCGLDCQSRITMIRDMGGCSFLTTLCNDYKFNSVGLGPCVVGGLVPPAFTATKANLEECETACEGATSCSGFSYSGTTCSLVSNIQPTDPSFVRSAVTNTTAAVQPVTALAAVSSAGVATTACYAKVNPQMIFNVYNNVFAVASLCYLTCTIMFAAAIVGAIYTFTVATGANAGSKKGLDVVLKKMCCPCLWPYRSGKQLQQGDLLGGAE